MIILKSQLIGRTEVSDEELRDKVKEYEAKWRFGMSRGGYLIKWDEVYLYRGFRYHIMCLKHFSLNLDDPLSYSVGDMKYGMHLVLEYPKDPRYEEINSFMFYKYDWDWLWNDTLHDIYRNWELDSMRAVLIERAEEDIDFLLKLYNRGLLPKKIKNFVENIMAENSRAPQVMLVLDDELTCVEVRLVEPHRHNL